MDYVISGDEGWWTGKCNGKGVVHHIVSPFSNFESTNFFNKNYYDNLFQLANLEKKKKKKTHFDQ